MSIELEENDQEVEVSVKPVAVKRQRRKSKSKSNPLPHIKDVRATVSFVLRKEYVLNRLILASERGGRDLRGSLLLRASEAVKMWTAVINSATVARDRAARIAAEVRGDLDGSSEAAAGE